MPITERDIVLYGKDENGNETLDMPVTRLSNIEDGAEIKASPEDADYVPIIDSSDGVYLKKTLFGSIKTALSNLFAAKSHTHAKADITGLPTSLPANGGNADTLEGKSASSFALARHNHDDRYYTQAELNQKFYDKADKIHYHHYAGSTVSGGTANSAKKLDVNAGSAVNPVYFSEGVPVNTTYTLEKSVPSNAVFTDTTYKAATTSANGLMTALDKTKLNGIAEGATKNIIDSALNSSSANAVQNKVITEALKSKADSTHTHNYAAASHNHSMSDITGGVLSVLRGGTGNSAGYITVGQVSGTVIGDYSTAEGFGTNACGIFAHAEGDATTASGDRSHSEGRKTVASGTFSHAGGDATVANTYAMFAAGSCNAYDADANAKSRVNYFVVGNGNSETSRSNAFRVSSSGGVFGGVYSSSGADYAEYFEWQDGNPENEDRRGLFVTLDGSRIRTANSKDDFILGIVSGDPSVIGDAHDDQWNKMYMRDIFGSPVFETVEIPEEKSELGIITPAYIDKRMKLNPDYDGGKKYIPRSERKEWSAVGMMGKLVVLDDGSCKTNGYCKPSDNGKAVNSETKTRYRVMDRLDESHIRILIL